MGMPSRFVVCYTTTDGVRADLHAYADGDGSLRDNNHVRKIVRDESIACVHPGSDSLHPSFLRVRGEQIPGNAVILEHFARQDAFPVVR